jgi:alkylhydroperoxidase family enzyme
MEREQLREDGAVAEDPARERSEAKPAEVRRVAEAVLDGPGETPNALRRSIEARAARLGGGEREEASIPSELEGYVHKVALYAHKVTDEDVEELKARGYSEDEIFEITIAAAFGAGLARMEKGFGVLKGGE